jgi:hypothetical protein
MSPVSSGPVRPTSNFHMNGITCHTPWQRVIRALSGGHRLCMLTHVWQHGMQARLSVNARQCQASLQACVHMRLSQRPEKTCAHTSTLTATACGRGLWRSLRHAPTVRLLQPHAAIVLSLRLWEGIFGPAIHASVLPEHGCRKRKNSSLVTLNNPLETGAVQAHAACTHCTLAPI